MMMKLSLFLLGIVSSVNTANADPALVLTENDFEETTAGKTVFIKFFAPRCRHCKAMTEDWQKLHSDWEDNEDVVVASVDCTDEDSEALCDEYDIMEYPALKFGDITDLQDYEGRRTYDELSAFAKKHLKPSCSINNIDLCSAEKKAFIEKYVAMSQEELESALDKVEDELIRLEDEAEETIGAMQEEYKKVMDNHMEKQKVMKKQNKYGLLKAIRAAKVFAEIKEMEEEEKKSDEIEKEE